MRLKKFSVCFLVSLVLMGGSVLHSDSVYASVSNTAKLTNLSTASSTVRSNKSEWHYRTVDGKLQKRLWSIPKNKWLTDWEWV